MCRKGTVHTGTDPPMRHLIGIDIGTSGIKTVIVDERGGLAARAFEEIPLHTPRPNWAEQDPADWWRAASKTVREAMSTAGVPAESIAGIGLSGQMHSSVLLDDRDEVLRPSILWCDTRTSEQCRWITEKAGEENLVEWVSNPALEGFTAPKLVWVRDHEPDVYDRIRRIMLPKDYIRFRMTGEYAMEVSDAAGTLLFDVRERRWSGPMLDAIGLPSGFLPPTFESIDVCGRVTAEVAADMGLKAGTPVVGGGADNTCGAVGAGIVRAGRILASLGTSGVIFAHTDDVRVDPQLRVHTFCHSVPDKWYLMGVTLFAGGAFKWLRNTLGDVETSAARMLDTDPYELLTAQAARAPAGCEGLVFLPYLMGERTPHKDANARGAFIGITGRHGRPHIIRSVMEGVTFALRDSIEIMRELGLSVGQVRSTGGGARSSLWRQIQADVYGAEVVTVNAGEGPAFGAAILAAVGTGVHGTVEEAADELVVVESRTEPNPKVAERYEECYGIFKSMYPVLKPGFDALGGMVGRQS